MSDWEACPQYVLLFALAGLLGILSTIDFFKVLILRKGARAVKETIDELHQLRKAWGAPPPEGPTIASVVSSECTCLWARDGDAFRLAARAKYCPIHGEHGVC